MLARARRSCWIAAVSALSLTRLASAQGMTPPSPGVTELDSEAAAMQRAKALFEKGVAAYSGGRYYEAIEIFAETDRLYPNPQLAFNIAKAYDNLGSKSGSLRYYRDYLRRSPDAPDRAAVEGRVRELETALVEQGVQQLSVISDPPEALLLIDDRPVGLTPWTGQTWPGKHKIELRRSDYRTESFVAEIEPHRSSDVTVVLHQASDAAPPKGKPGPSSQRRELRAGRLNVLTWTALGTAGGALGTALVIEAAGGDSESAIRPGTAFFAGLGSAAAVLGGVLLYFRSSESAAPSSESNVALRFTRGGASARYTARF
jgi:tetratricopeptide (TPR) repeat protein